MFLVGLFLVSLEAAAARPQLHSFEAVEPHMGTLVSIKLYARDQAQARAAVRAAFDRIAGLDEILSDYKPASELNRIVLSAVGRPAKISDDLFRVLEASEALSDASGGAFDVTVGPVVRLWRQARKEHQLPDRDALDAALSHCGYRKLHLDGTAHTVKLDQDGMQLDLGGIAKGYAADQALMVLKKLGIRSALVAASGDIACSDAPPGHKGWNIEIDAKRGVAELNNAAVSTSGDSEQYLDADGKRYSHIVDPITGFALTNRIMVSVIAGQGILADGLATAISVLGEMRGRQLAKKYPGVSIFVRSTAGDSGTGRRESVDSKIRTCAFQPDPARTTVGWTFH